MLERTERRLDSYFQKEPQIGSDGQLHEIDSVTRISKIELSCFRELLEKAQPELSIECGMAYGFSTLTILDFMEMKGRGHHIAIDPGQVSLWHGIALNSIEDLGFKNRFTWIESYSDAAIPQMRRDQKRVQFVFLDGVQYFDGIITDFVLASKILDVGGIIVFNQLWMPGGRAAASFVSNNATNFSLVQSRVISL